MRHTALTRPLSKLLLSITLGITLVVGLGATVASADGPRSDRLMRGPAEPAAGYVGETRCEPVARPGTQALRDLVLAHYRAGRDSSMARACTDGVSEHEEGRAWDWGLNAADARERAIGDEFVAWLTGPDARGEPAGNARRLGVMYVIWNRMTWKAYRAEQGWQPYTGSNPHTDHVHISLSWDGALKRTSWWSGTSILSKAPALPSTSRATLRSGETLAGGVLVSTDSAHVLSMGRDGNLAQLADRRQVWTTRTGIDPGARLVMQTDGNAVLYGSNGQPRWWSGTAGHAGATLTVQTDGNVVVYGTDGAPLWWNATAVDELSSAPVVLKTNQTLRSTSGGHVLVVQGDGNLVTYDGAGRPTWWSGTSGSPGGRLVLQEDGNLVLYSGDGRPLWFSGTASRHQASRKLILQGDGNLVLYNVAARWDEPMWASRR